MFLAYFCNLTECNIPFFKFYTSYLIRTSISEFFFYFIFSCVILTGDENDCRCRAGRTAAIFNFAKSQQLPNKKVKTEQSFKFQQKIFAVVSSVFFDASFPFYNARCFLERYFFDLLKINRPEKINRILN